jgi:hypothetical protein
MLTDMTHSIVQAQFQSLYISQLVKTRDPHPGLLRFTIIILFSSFSQYCLYLSSFFSLLPSFFKTLLPGPYSGGAVMPSVTVGRP